MSPRNQRETASRILDVAEGLVQVRGFNAFSYADIAKALGIQKASLHHHYATKAELGVALVTRYRRTFMGALHKIEAGDIAFEGSAASMASLMVSSLEGAMLVVRGSGNLAYFDEVVGQLLERLRPPNTTRRRRKAA